MAPCTRGATAQKRSWARMHIVSEMDHVAEMKRERHLAELCADGQHARLVESARRSAFYLCQRSVFDRHSQNTRACQSSSAAATRSHRAIDVGQSGIKRRTPRSTVVRRGVDHDDLFTR